MKQKKIKVLPNKMVMLDNITGKACRVVAILVGLPEETLV